IGCRVVPVGPGDAERTLFALRAGIADTLVGTPSFAQYLANRVEQAEPSAVDWPLAQVVTGGEPGGGIPEVRDHIQRVLGVRVNEAMGIGDVFIVRGVNVYPTAILSVVGGFRPRVTGRARVLKVGPGVSIEPPVPVEVEVPEGGADAALAGEIEAAIRAVLTFRAGVRLVPESQFGEAGYKTRLTVPQP